MTDHRAPMMEETQPAMGPEVQAQLAGLGKTSLLVHTDAPLNAETPLALLDQPLTACEHMFMRNNHAVPSVSQAEWRLTIDGLVRAPLTIGYAELRTLPAIRYTAVLECSGNGRQRFADAGMPTEGVPWRDGAVANAEWTGVPLRLLLDRVGVAPGAVQAECVSAGEAGLVRGVEVAKLHEDAMLAYAMNGVPLPAIHGGPVRLVVPGWGGINWVKWLVRMRLIDHESASEYNQQSYVLYDADGQPYGKVRALKVKSLLTNIASGAELRAGACELRGLAWSAGFGIERVELSVDGGASWAVAELLADMGPHAWRGFVWPWQAAPGRYRIGARATDRAGNTQPVVAPFNRRGYLMNAVQQLSAIVL